jgi:hypothetical protein
MFCENVTLYNNYKIINYLTSNIKNLTLENYKRKISNLPNSIKTIKMNNCEDKIIIKNITKKLIKT